jgi:RHS repeat-associated protein
VYFGFRKNWRDGIMTIRYYHADLSGKPAELTDPDGTVQWRARHGAWGKTHIADGSHGPHQPLRFQGQYFDTETGLHYNLHRYYDPDAGRFTSQDPIGLRGDVNVYRYAPNPLGWVDPLGLAPFCLNLLRPGTFGGFAENYNASMGGYVFTTHAYGSLGGQIQGLTTPGGDLRTISAGQMSRRVMNAPGYQEGQPIAFLACHAGSARPGGREPYAQEMANATGADVFAPDGKLIRNPDGTCSVLGNGFVRFTPMS